MAGACSDRFQDYAKGVYSALKAAGIRAELDGRDEKIGYKIRDARLNRIPYMLIVGEKEELDKTISVRSREEGEQGSCTVETFVNRVLDEIQRKAR